MKKETGNCNAKMSQCERVVKYMKDFNSITSLEAVQDLGILSLPKRISELRKMHKAAIKIEPTKGTNRYGETVYYNRYSLCKGAEQPEWIKRI